MKISYQPTAAEFAEAYALRWKTFSRRLMRYWMMAIGGFLLLIVVWRIRAFKQIELFDVGTFLLAVFWLGYPTFLRWFVRAHFAKHPNLHGPFQVEIHGDGIRFDSAKVTWDFRWTAYTKTLETKNLFVLHQGECDYSFLPKHAFTPTQVEDFRALLQQKVPAK